MFLELEFAVTELHTQSLLKKSCIDPEWVRIAMSSSSQPRAVVEIMLKCLTFEDVTDKARGNVTEKDIPTVRGRQAYPNPTSPSVLE
jgi:hypothetical protein